MRFIKRAEAIFQKTVKRLKGYKTPNDFSKIATEILTDSDIHKYYNDSAIGEILSLKKLPKQNYILRNFSDAPVTLFQHEKFYLDLYFWRHSDTDIHNHHFTGAFKMLSGKQHQFIYEFQGAKKLYPFLYQGKMSLCSSQELLPGDCTPILLGDDFIHQTIHHKDLATANICLRTVHLPEHDLYSFRMNGFKIKHLAYNPERLIKLSVLKTLPSNQRKSVLNEYLKTLTLYELISLYKGNHFTAQFVDEEFKTLIRKWTKKYFPKDYQILRAFFEEIADHETVHKKMRFFLHQ